MGEGQTVALGHQLAYVGGKRCFGNIRYWQMLWLVSKSVMTDLSLRCRLQATRIILGMYVIAIVGKITGNNVFILTENK
jgi:hypothetical protein